MRSRTESMGCNAVPCGHPGRPCAAKGQGTVEYALVTAAFIAVVIALGALWRFLSEGGFAAYATESLTHRLMRGVSDLVLF